MTPDAVFQIANKLALAGWILLAVAPGWRWTARLITAVALPALFAAGYLAILVMGAGRLDPRAFASLAGVEQLFSDRAFLLAGWLHYLAFDLIVGSWEVRDRRRLGISHFMVLPCLLLTFLFGPVGWLAYVVLRGLLRRQAMVDEARGDAQLVS